MSTTLLLIIIVSFALGAISTFVVLVSHPKPVPKTVGVLTVKNMPMDPDSPYLLLTLSTEIETLNASDKISLMVVHQ